MPPPEYWLAWAAYVHMDALDASDAAVADKFARLAELSAGPLLAARLEDRRVPPDRLGHEVGPADGQRQRLLAVDVLAATGRLDGAQGVPVVGHGDEHRLDVVPGEHLAVVHVALAVAAAVRGVDEVDRHVAELLVDLRDAEDPDLAVLDQAAQVVLALLADADEAHRDAVARGRAASAQDVGCQHGRGGRGQGGGLQKPSA